MEQKSSRFTIDNKTAQGDVRQASIGQGQTLVTPLQNILLVCASVNGGELMQPYVVDRIEDANGNTVSENTPKSLGKKMSEKEAKQLKKLMRGTVKVERRRLYTMERHIRQVERRVLRSSKTVRRILMRGLSATRKKW